MYAATKRATKGQKVIFKRTSDSGLFVVVYLYYCGLMMMKIIIIIIIVIIIIVPAYMFLFLTERYALSTLQPCWFVEQLEMLT